MQANIRDTNDYYGGNEPEGTRVLFVNGNIDPWHVLSVLHSLSPELPAFVVPGASHHAWTHPAAPTDSAAIVRAREQITAIVDGWLQAA